MMVSNGYRNSDDACEADMTADQRVFFRTLASASLVGCLLFFVWAFYRSGWSQDLLVPALAMLAAILGNLVVFGFFDEETAR